MHGDVKFYPAFLGVFVLLRESGVLWWLSGKGGKKAARGTAVDK